MCKGTTVEQNRTAVALVKGAGIRVWGNFVVGAPGETEDDLRATFAFIEATDPDLVALNRFFLVPATAFARRLVREGRLAPDYWAVEARDSAPLTAHFAAMAPERVGTMLKQEDKSP